MAKISHGWYENPNNKSDRRYFDGSIWYDREGKRVPEHEISIWEEYAAPNRDSDEFVHFLSKTKKKYTIEQPTTPILDQEAEANEPEVEARYDSAPDVEVLQEPTPVPNNPNAKSGEKRQTTYTTPRINNKRILGILLGAAAMIFPLINLPLALGAAHEMSVVQRGETPYALEALEVKKDTYQGKPSCVISFYSSATSNEISQLITLGSTCPEEGTIMPLAKNNHGYASYRLLEDGSSAATAAIATNLFIFVAGAAGATFAYKSDRTVSRRRTLTY